MNIKNAIKYKTLSCVMLLGVFMWYFPVFSNIETKSWHLFVIFFTTVLAVILNPAPMSILSLMAISACILTQTLSVGETLNGFSQEIVWLVVFAFFISRAIIKSRLGQRIAYIFISKMGSSPIGVSYSLILTELLIAPVIPSATARGGAIIFPIAQAIGDQYAALNKDDKDAMLMKHFLMKICFQANIITSAMFMTAMVGNPFIAKLAGDIGVELDWLTWAKAAIIPGMLNLALLPFVMLYTIRPNVKSCTEAVETAKIALKDMGRITKNEIIVLCTFTLLLALWIFGKSLGISATTTALIGCILLMLFGVITLDDATQEKNAWDAFIWFGIFVTLSDALSKSGIMQHVGEYMQVWLVAVVPYTAAVILVVLFFYMHYFFASITVYATVMYTTFALLLIHLGFAPLPTCLLLAFLANISACLTHYGITPAPIFFNGSGMSVRKWLSIGLLSSFPNILIWTISAALTWKKLGIAF